MLKFQFLSFSHVHSPNNQNMATKGRRKPPSAAWIAREPMNMIENPPNSKSNSKKLNQMIITPKLHVQCSSQEPKTVTRFPFLRCSQVLPPNNRGKKKIGGNKKIPNQNLAPKSIKARNFSFSYQTRRKRKTYQQNNNIIINNTNNIPANLSKVFSDFQQTTTTTIKLYMIQRYKEERERRKGGR